MPVFVGQNFTLRENKITVGTGKVTRLLDPIPTAKHTKLVKMDVPNSLALTETEQREAQRERDRAANKKRTNKK